MPIALGRVAVPLVAVVAIALGTQAVVATPTVPAASSPRSVAPYATVTTGTKAVFVPVPQKRVLNTTSISPASPRKVTVAGVAGVPTDAVAVVVNVAAVKPAKAGYLVAYPAGTARPPTVFTLTYAAGQVDESVATVKVGSLRQIAVYASTTAPVVVDVVGYYVNHNHDDAYLTKAQAQGRTAAGAFLCPNGSLIKSVAADGATTCVQDATGPVSGVGGGLLLVDGVLSGQGRTAANAFTCPVGQYLRSVDEHGSPTCVTDATGGGTSFAVGDGLDLVDGVLSAEQGRSAVNAFACPTGSYLRTVAKDGTPTCNTDRDTTYSAGVGLLLTVGVFSAEQGRSAPNAFTCPAGQYLQSVAANGAPTCVADKDTTYAAGAGLSLANGVFTAEQRRSVQDAFTCPPGQYLRVVAADGTPTCAADVDTNTTYSAGFGLLLANGVFSAEQGRSATNAFTCPTGQYLQVVAANGAPTCAADRDTDTNTTYEAGFGLLLEGAMFSAEQGRSAKFPFYCEQGTFMREVADDGLTTCDTDQTGPSYSAGFGLLLTNGVFSAQQGRSAANAFTCGIGEFLRSVAADGTPTCATATAYTAGAGITISGNTISAHQSRSAANAFTCPTGQALRQVGADGAPTCVAVPAYTAGSGLLLSGSTFSAAHGSTVVPVRGDLDPVANGTALRSAMNAITDASSTKPYVISLAPGTFNIGTTGLSMKQYVSIVGAGRGISTITGSVLSQAGGLVNLGNNTTLARVTVTNASDTGTNWATGVWATNVTARLVEVDATGSQVGSESYGLIVFSGAQVTAENSRFVAVNPATLGVAVYVVSSAHLRARGVEAAMSSPAGYALHAYNSSSIQFGEGYANGPVRRGTDNASLQIVNSRIDGAVTGGVQCSGNYSSAFTTVTCT